MNGRWLSVSPRTWKKCTFTLVAGLLVCGCQPAPHASSIRTVLTVPLEQSAESRLHFVGWVKPRAESRLGFRVPGRITRRLVNVGDVVARGQLLALLDTADLAVERETRQAQLAAATASAQLSTTEQQRTATLAQRGMVSSSALAQREADVKVARGVVDAARKQVEAASLAVAHARLVADADGIVTTVYAEPGEVVAPATPIVAIASLSDREVELHVPERHLQALSVGTAVDAELSGAGVGVRGIVRERAPAADAVLGTYRVRVSLPADGQGALFGSKAIVRLLSGASSFQVPVSAVVGQAPSTTTATVWQVDERGRAHARAVELLRIGEGHAHVRGPLDTTQAIVAAGAQRLHEGESVRALDRLARSVRREGP